MLMRVYVTLDQEHRIVLPTGIRKALSIRPGDKLSLTLVGMNAAKKALLSKPRERKIHEKNAFVLGDRNMKTMHSAGIRSIPKS